MHIADGTLGYFISGLPRSIPSMKGFHTMGESTVKHVSLQNSPDYLRGV